MRVLIILTILGSALAVPDHTNRIIGGSETTIETYPFMANVQHSLFGVTWVHGCGGILITPTSVLTAAQCLEFQLINRLRIVLGSTLRSGAGGDFHATNRIIFHPSYNVATNVDADVAVARLTVRAVLSERIQTVPIASAGTELDPGLPVTVIGWGTLWHQGASPNNLQQVQVNVIDRNLCAERYAQLKTRPGYGNWPDVTNNMVCAGILNEGGRDFCQGDTGGPVVFRALGSNILVGIPSWGYRCGEPNYPGVLVNLPRFATWIVEQVN